MKYEVITTGGEVADLQTALTDCGNTDKEVISVLPLIMPATGNHNWSADTMCGYIIVVRV